jgi:RecA/RadA recombinase
VETLKQARRLLRHLRSRNQATVAFITNYLENIDTNFNELKNYFNRFKNALGFFRL